MTRGMYEPKHGPLKVRPIRAHCTERVRITWTFPDGSTVSDDVTAPTPEVITARKGVGVDGFTGQPVECWTADAAQK